MKIILGFGENFKAQICMNVKMNRLQLQCCARKTSAQNKKMNGDEKKISDTDNYMEKMKQWNSLTESDLELYRANPEIAKTIVRLFEEGFKCSEDDPIMFLAVDPQNIVDSFVYINGGNYGLNAQVIGAAAWPGGQIPIVGAPYPPGVDAAPPMALGRYIFDTFQAMNITDLSMGSYSVFKIPDLHTFGLIDAAVKGSVQFGRFGQRMAQLINIQPQRVLVKCILLTSVNGTPQLIPGFTSTG